MGTTDNRNLKSSLLEAERYREEYREVAEILALLKRKKNEVAADIKKTKEDLQKARMEGAIPKAKKYAPKFNKDTKVNLDMSMWITHNYTKEEQEEYAPKLELAPYEPPKYYPPKYEEPKYEEPKGFDGPKYEKAPKYEAPKYEETTTGYEAPAYSTTPYDAATTYEAPATYEASSTYEAPATYEAPTTTYEAPKTYEEPATEEPKYEEPAKYEEPESESEEEGY